MKHIVITSLLLGSVAWAESPQNYITLSPVLLQHDESGDGTQSDFRSSAFKWTLGRVLQEREAYHVAVESAFMTGITRKEKTTVIRDRGGVLNNAGIMIDKLYSLNLKVGTTLLTNLELNGYIGMSHAKTIATADNYNEKNSYNSSLSYGAGVAYRFTSDVHLYMNYMQYFSDLSAVEAGVGFRF